MSVFSEVKRGVSGCLGPISPRGGGSAFALSLTSGWCITANLVQPAGATGCLEPSWGGSVWSLII